MKKSPVGLHFEHKHKLEFSAASEIHDDFLWIHNFVVHQMLEISLDFWTFKVSHAVGMLFLSCFVFVKLAIHSFALVLHSCVIADTAILTDLTTSNDGHPSNFCFLRWNDN